MQIETHIQREQVPYGVVHVGTGLESRTRIGLDVDGVLAGFHQALIDRAHNLGRTHWPLTWREISGWYTWGDVKEQEVNEFFKEIWEDKEFWLSIEPMEDAFHLHFNPVAYVTARTIPSEVTAEWLNLHGFPFARVYTVGVNESKIDVLRELKITHFVEDKAEAAVEINQAGILCYLLNRPWNINVVVPDYVPRIVSLKDIIL